jgi:hypothetical protein
MLKQDITGSNYVSDSPVWRKQTKAKCENVATQRAMLLAGRNCKNSYECMSYNCTDTKCNGYGSGATCASHSECGAGLACLPDIEWPYQTSCNSLIKQGFSCRSDFECGMNSICWYQTRAQFYSDDKRCMQKGLIQTGFTFGWAPKYYNDYQDIMHNGQVCAS